MYPIPPQFKSSSSCNYNNHKHETQSFNSLDFSTNKSWEDRSEEENTELQDLPKSIIPESKWIREDTRINIDYTDDEDENFSPRWENWEAEMLVGRNNQSDLYRGPGLASHVSLDEDVANLPRSFRGRRRCLSIDNMPFSNTLLRNFGQYVRLGHSPRASRDTLPTISKSCFSLLPHSEN